MLLRSGSFMVGDNNNKKVNKKVSMKLMASLAPARAEVEAGAVAKPDQYQMVSSEKHSNEQTNILTSI